MARITFIEKDKKVFNVPSDLVINKRHLSTQEIEILEKNQNTSEFSSWENVFVPKEIEDFDASLIRNSRFEGYVILGRLKAAKLKYHNLELETGIINSLIRNSVMGNDNAVQNVLYLENYRTGDRVILFNIQELSCTKSAKFGNGYIFSGEKETERKWIGVANENDGRAILPFEKMISSDAYLWSSNRDDAELLNRFIELTDNEKESEGNIYGIIGNDVVIKNTLTIKDVKIGDFAYIKGALKLKNVTILSGEDEVSQIGEGVEMVNGIMNAGSHVFYQAVAVRFVIGRNCQLKYGARLLNSFFGDNSTVS